MTALGRSDRKILAALTLSELVAYGLRQHYSERSRSKTALSLADRLCRRCDEAAVACALRNAVCASDIDRIARRMRRFEQMHLAGKAIPLTVCTSLALGALDEPLQMLKDGPKKTSLEQVEMSVRRVHMYLDRRMDRWQEYAEATRLLTHFEEIVCA